MDWLHSPLQSDCHSAYYKKGRFATTETDTSSEQLCWETENLGYSKKSSSSNFNSTLLILLFPYYCFEHLHWRFTLDSSAAIVTSFQVQADYELIYVRMPTPPS